MGSSADQTDGRGKSRRAFWIVGAVLGVIVLFVLGSLRPMAPRRLDILTGPPGSAYQALGQRFAAALGQNGITARVVETHGALDNLSRLSRSDEPTVGFAQSQVERELDDQISVSGVVSLGSLGFQPLWLFVWGDLKADRMADLAGKRVVLPPKGSGSRALAELVLETSDVLDKVTTVHFEEHVGTATADTLLSDPVDAAFLVGGIRAPVVSRLLDAEGVEPRPFTRAQTYAALFPGLAPFTVPAGAFDMARDIPAADLQLLAATTNLVASDELHGALVEVLIDAAKDVQKPTLEVPAGMFPSMKYVSLPLSPRARRYYEQGPSALGRMLPYRVSALVDQLVFVVLPALAIVFAILKIVPLAVGLRFSLRSVVMLRRMVAIERDSIAGGDPRELWEALDELDRKSVDMHVPPPRSASYLELRQNIHDARERLVARGQPRPLPDVDA